jgi:transcriptional regulator with XRE-family HTH domain
MSRFNEEDVLTRFGENVWWLRTQRRVKQASLAERSEVHRTQITLIQAGRRSPTVVTLAAIAGGLDVPVGAFFDGITWIPSSTGGLGEFRVEPLDLPTISWSRR